MRAVIIEDDRFIDAIDAMKLHALQLKDSNTPERVGWDQEMWEAAIREVHGSMHCQFVRWAQSHGARCVR